MTPHIHSTRQADPVPGLAAIRNACVMFFRSLNLSAFARSRCVTIALSMLAVAALVVIPIRANAQANGCYKIEVPTSIATSEYYTDPGTVTRAWSGSIDAAGQGAFAMTININAPPFVPDGTLLGSVISPIYNLGSSGIGSYSPEQVLFRCSPDSGGSMYEYYSTNGDSAWAGATDVSAQSGIPGTYLAYYTGSVFRVTNVTNGDILSRYWKARPLTGLDKDSKGWFLVKAKNFSQYKLEYFQCTTCQAGATTGTGSSPESQPVGYVAFVGGNSGNIIKGNLSVGADAATNWNGWHLTWPGAINPYLTVNVRRAATCAVTNATPFVRFPTMTVSDLNRGQSKQLPVTIQMQCQSTTPLNMDALRSGTAATQTALGLLAQPENAQSAISAGLRTAGSGVTWLLSDGYGTDPSAATGVGVALSRPDGTPLNFLTNQYVTTGGAKDGWDPVLNDATADGPQVSGIVKYTRTVNATFKAFAPGVTPVTPGHYNATAQVIVRVQ